MTLWTSWIGNTTVYANDGRFPMKFLFCDTAKGADASALCFSVIETAKRNKLDPFGYLQFLLQELYKLGNEPTREQLLPLLPWSTVLPEYCHLS